MSKSTGEFSINIAHVHVGIMVYICVTHTFFRLSTDTQRLFPLVVGIVGDVHVLASAKVIG